MVGKTEEDCLKEGRAYDIGRAYYRNTARGQIIGDTAGMLKMVFDPADHTLLGLHLIGDEATELIHVGLLGMQLGGTLETFVQSVFNYPTLADIYKHAAEDGLGRLARRQRQHSRRQACDTVSSAEAQPAREPAEATAVRADAPAASEAQG